MAHYTERHLKSKETEDFLKSRGYVLVPHVSKSMWSGHPLPLYLDEDDVIVNDDALVRKIYEMGYEDGKNEGKLEAVNAIQKTLFAIVFPPEI